MEAFAGSWVVNPKTTTSQEPLLKAMGKPAWQIYAINMVQEDFQLQHSKEDSPLRHIFHKHVKLSLADGILKQTIGRLFTLPFTEMEYDHTFIQNEKQKFPDDLKGFGDCETFTSVNEEKRTFTIRWQLKTLNGLLIATHQLISDDEFLITMTFQKPKQPIVSVQKGYVRALSI